MTLIELQTYTIPKVAVLEIKSEGVICSSVTVNSVTLEDEEDW